MSGSTQLLTRDQIAHQMDAKLRAHYGPKRFWQSPTVKRTGAVALSFLCVAAITATFLSHVKSYRTAYPRLARLYEVGAHYQVMGIGTAIAFLGLSQRVIWTKYPKESRIEGLLQKAKVMRGCSPQDIGWKTLDHSELKVIKPELAYYLLRDHCQQAIDANYIIALKPIGTFIIYLPSEVQQALPLEQAPE